MFYFYSYDERPVNKTHWVDTSIFGTRVWYHSEWTPPALLLDSAQAEDAGIYRCRVDYQKTNTRQAWVQLHVVGEFKTGLSSDFLHRKT